MYRSALILACCFGAIAVILGAFGAHSLKEIAEPYILDIWNKGVSYQFYHTFALLACGILYATFPTRLVKAAAWLFAAGILGFSGSLYVLSAILINHSGGANIAGPVTPVGGLCFIIGWICLLIALFKKPAL